MLLESENKDYWKIFEVNVKGIVSAKAVREELIRQLMTGDSHEGEVIVRGPEDANTPLYRNGAGYKGVEIDHEKVKKLTVHFYYTGLI